MDKIRRPSTWPDWQSEIESTEGPAEVGVGDHVIGDARMLGFAVAGRADISAVDDRGLVQDVIVGIRMRVSYSITPDGDGWMVTHKLAADLPRGLSGRVLSFFLRRRLARMQRELLDSLSIGAAGKTARESVSGRDLGAAT
jgi:hypothetical protein